MCLIKLYKIILVAIGNILLKNSLSNNYVNNLYCGYIGMDKLFEYLLLDADPVVVVSIEAPSLAILLERSFPTLIPLPSLELRLDDSIEEFPESV